MKVDGRPFRSIWLDEDGRTACLIDQRWIPQAFWIVGMVTLDEAIEAIRLGKVRGRPVVAAVCAYGVAFAMREDSSTASLASACTRLEAAASFSLEARRALAEMRAVLLALRPRERQQAAYDNAAALCERDIERNACIGRYGRALLLAAARRKSRGRLNVLVPAGFGWLSTVDGGTAMAPVFMAREAGLSVHVWLETAGSPEIVADLARWELAGQGVPHTVVAADREEALMEDGAIDMAILGAQCVTRGGDVCNTEPLGRWAGLATRYRVPCYATATAPVIGWELALTQGSRRKVDITRSHLLTGLITDRGICKASAESLLDLFPDRLAA